MTKYDLLRMLEPFDDEIEIVLQVDGYKYSPYAFYQGPSLPSPARILLSTDALLNTKIPRLVGLKY